MGFGGWRWLEELGFRRLWGERWKGLVDEGCNVGLVVMMNVGC